MIKNYPNITLSCWIFSQDIIYKLNVNKKISRLLVSLIEFLSQFDFFSVSASATILQFNQIRTKFYLKIEVWRENCIISTNVH